MLADMKPVHQAENTVFSLSQRGCLGEILRYRRGCLAGHFSALFPVRLHKKDCGQIAEKQLLCFHSRIIQAAGGHAGVVRLRHAQEHGFQVTDPLQLAGIRDTLIYIPDAIAINKQVQRCNGPGVAAREGGELIILIEHMLRQPDTMALIECRAVCDAVEGQASVEAAPIRHDLFQRKAFPEFPGVAAPIADLSGADIHSVEMGQDNIAFRFLQKTEKSRKIFRYHPIVRVNDLEIFALRGGTSGVQGAPWRIELAFCGISRISNPHMTMPIHGDEVIVLKDSDFEVTDGFSSMTVGPAFGVHHFTDGKEDSEAKTVGAATVYLTDYTEFHHVISIRP